MATITRIESGARMSKAVVHGDTVYVAGIVAEDLSADTAGQTKQILTEIDRLLALAGTDKTKLLRTNIWLADIADFHMMNKVWDAWVSAGNTPARATVQASLATPAHRVEIMVVAAK